MAHYCICYYCKERFNRDKIEFIQIAERRYAHKTCAEARTAEETQEEQDKQALENYIMEIFDLKYVDVKIQKQIEKYIKENNYTYSGIHKALYYHFNIKHGSIEKANFSIGIVPYVYSEAYRYYYSLWEAQQRNEDKDIAAYVPVEKEIRISPPERQVKKRKLFSFLDKEED